MGSKGYEEKSVAETGSVGFREYKRETSMC